MDKLKLHSPNLIEGNIAKIAELFPSCIVEARDDNGALTRKVDFDQLRQELSNSIVEGPQERYRLDWPGKRESLLAANAPIAKTLRPCREESVDFDTTQNLFIEGDNLDALKLLQETYLGKVQMIYIDPPYNTGKDFIYADDFAENSNEYFGRSNQVSNDGERLISNTEANGRFHSDWLSMMHSRLKLSRNLLSKEGAIFISINDGEVSNLKKLCDEVFGDDNFLACLSWRTDGNFDNQAKFKTCHEYILVYGRNAEHFPTPPVIDPSIPKTSKLFNDEIRNTIVKNGPANPESEVCLPVGFPCEIKNGSIEARNDKWPHYEEEAKIANNKLTHEARAASGWSSKDLLVSFIQNDCKPIQDAKGQETRFIISKTGAIEAIKKRADVQSHVISTLTNLGGSQKAAQHLEDLGIIFDDYPKPVELIKYFVSMISDKNAVILDFFAGSGTTADAILQKNTEDSGSRKFILVQIPESCADSTKAFKAGYETIAEISKDRIRKASKRIKEKHATIVANHDIGFRVLKIDTSNAKDIYYTPDAINQKELALQVDHIKDDRTAEDLLFQVMLDWGVDLALPIASESIQGKTVYFVDENAIAACFDTQINESFVKELAKREPLRVVFRDTCFESDSAKINVAEIFKLLSPNTDIKTI